MENREELYANECELCSFRMHENDFLCIYVKNSVHTFDKQFLSFRVIERYLQGRKTPLLLDLSAASLILYKLEAKEHLAEILPKLFSAVAVLAPSTLQKVAPTIFLNTMGEPLPIRIFDTEKEAREWLWHYG
jgi:hypothetical protein